MFGMQFNRVEIFFGKIRRNKNAYGKIKINETP